MSNRISISAYSKNNINENVKGFTSSSGFCYPSVMADMVASVLKDYNDYYQCTYAFDNFTISPHNPLPLSYQYLLAILASGRHRCRYLTHRCEERLLQMNRTASVEHLGRDHPGKRVGRVISTVPPRSMPMSFNGLFYLNRLLAHRPWIIDGGIISRVMWFDRNNPLSVGELMHALYIMINFHALSGFIYGCGLEGPGVEFLGHCTLSNYPSLQNLFRNVGCDFNYTDLSNMPNAMKLNEFGAHDDPDQQDESAVHWEKDSGCDLEVSHALPTACTKQKTSSLVYRLSSPIRKKCNKLIVDNTTCTHNPHLSIIKTPYQYDGEGYGQSNSMKEMKISKRTELTSIASCCNSSVTLPDRQQNSQLSTTSRSIKDDDRRPHDSHQRRLDVNCCCGGNKGRLMQSDSETVSQKTVGAVFPSCSASSCSSLLTNKIEKGTAILLDRKRQAVDDDPTEFSANFSQNDFNNKKTTNSDRNSEGDDFESVTENSKYSSRNLSCFRYRPIKVREKLGHLSLSIEQFNWDFCGMEISEKLFPDSSYFIDVKFKSAMSAFPIDPSKSYNDSSSDVYSSLDSSDSQDSVDAKCKKYWNKSTGAVKDACGQVRFEKQPLHLIEGNEDKFQSIRRSIWEYVQEQYGVVRSTQSRCFSRKRTKRTKTVMQSSSFLTASNSNGANKWRSIVNSKGLPNDPFSALVDDENSNISSSIPAIYTGGGGVVGYGESTTCCSKLTSTATTTIRNNAFSQLNEMLYEGCLNKSVKNFIKIIATCPEQITRTDFEKVLKYIPPTLLIMVNIVIREARFQCELLYALRAVHQYMQTASVPPSVY